MSKNLLIVESPAKARTINKYLGPDFVVKASVGHVVDLPPKDLGVDLEHEFQPKYQVIKGKEKIIKELRQAAKGADSVFLAPDPDREGEAIAMHIAQQLGRPLDEYHRVLFHELTKKAIQKAVAEPLKLNQHRYDSQQARRVLDRLVGYQISPLLWEKVKRGLSAGRVQSVALRLVVERERAIQAFEPQEYWDITAHLEAAEPPPFTARLARLDNKKFDPKTKDQTDAGLKAIENADYIVTGIKKRKRNQRPAPPFITSTLQQEAFRKLGFTPKRTMALAQRLYEGQETDQGQVGLITYMRTDSVRLAGQAVDEAREVIAGRFGPDYLPAKPNFYKTKGSAQDAHEAIRPTAAARTPESMAKYLKRDELKLYRLIWNRFMACQMAPAVFDQTQLEITAGPALFRASGQVLVFKGFMAVYVEDKDEAENGKDKPQDGMLPPVREGDKLKLDKLDPKQHFTQPPPRFTEASLVKELEEKGIGRPSTYASILSTLQDKDYVQRLKGKRLAPSELGLVVNDLLVESFPQIMEVDFTAGLERSLDKVEEGDTNWRKLLGDFYGPFSKALEEAKSNMRQIKGKGVETEVDCPECGKKMSVPLQAESARDPSRRTARLTTSLAAGLLAALVLSLWIGWVPISPDELGPIVRFWLGGQAGEAVAGKALVLGAGKDPPGTDYRPGGHGALRSRRRVSGAVSQPPGFPGHPRGLGRRHFRCGPGAAHGRQQLAGHPVHGLRLRAGRGGHGHSHRPAGGRTAHAGAGTGRSCGAVGVQLVPSPCSNTSRTRTMSCRPSFSG